MSDESISTSITVAASAEQVFDFLADPANHPAIDGTGRVRESLDEVRICAAGQVFRVDMFHENHPDGTYRMSNLVIAFDRPRAIGWKPGYVSQETGGCSWWLVLALRPRADRSALQRGHADLRLVGRRTGAAGVHDLPAVPGQPLR